MNTKNQFEVFISYRNSYDEILPDGTTRKLFVGFGVAKEVAFLLNYKHYNVYFDNLTLSGGDDYERHIFKSIPQCSDVILVLVPGALDRCSNADDIFGREIIAALEGGKNIIPIFVNGFSLPERIDDLPEILREPAKKYQEKTGRNFVRLQGAKVQTTEIISADNSRMIKNTILAEVLPYLKSRPKLGAVQSVPSDIPSGKESPFGEKPTKKIIQLVLALCVLATGGVVYWNLMQHDSSKQCDVECSSSGAGDGIGCVTNNELEKNPSSEQTKGDAPENKDAANTDVFRQESSEEKESNTETKAEESSSVPEDSEVVIVPGTPAMESDGEGTPLSNGDIGKPEERRKNSDPGTKIVEEVAPAVYSIEDLVEAVQAGTADRVSEILASGIDVDGLAENGATALCSAVVRENIAVVEALLKAKANPNFVWRASKNWTPLHLAALFGGGKASTAEIVKLLLEYGADPSSKDADGKRPAAYAGSDDVRVLLSQ